MDNKKRTNALVEEKGDNKSQLSKMLDFAIAKFKGVEEAVATKMGNERGSTHGYVIGAVLVICSIFGLGYLDGSKTDNERIKEYTKQIASHYNLTVEDAETEIEKAVARYNQLQKDKGRGVRDNVYGTTLVETAEAMKEKYGGK